MTKNNLSWDFKKCTGSLDLPLLMLLWADAQYLITNFMIISYNKWRGSRLQMFFKMVVLKNFAIFAKKHLWWILFLTNLFNKSTYFEKHLQTAAFEI